MGKIVLVALVGVWLFNLARLIAGGLPDHALDRNTAAFAGPHPATIGAEGLQADAPALPEGVAIAIRSAQVSSNEQGTIAVGVTLAEPAIVDLDLFDSTGRRIFSQTSRRLPAGRSSIRLQNVDRLHDGHYWIRARVGDQVATTTVAIDG